MYVSRAETKFSEKISSSKSITDEALKSLLTQPLRAGKKKNKSKTGANGAATEATETKE